MLLLTYAALAFKVISVSNKQKRIIYFKYFKNCWKKSQKTMILEMLPHTAAESQQAIGAGLIPSIAFAPCLGPAPREGSNRSDS